MVSEIAGIFFRSSVTQFVDKGTKLLLQFWGYFRNPRRNYALFEIDIWERNVQVQAPALEGIRDFPSIVRC